MTPRRILRPALVLLRVLIAVGVVWLLATKVDYRRLATTAQGASVPLLLASVGVFFADYLIKTYKWALLLNGQGIRVPFWQLFKVSMKGYFISFFAPSAITADLYKGVALFTEVGAGHTVMSSIVLERLLGMTSIVIVNLAAVTLLPARLFGLNNTVGLVVVAIVTAAILVAFLHADRVSAMVLHWLPARWHRAKATLEQLAAAFAEYRPKRGLLTGTLLMSFGLQVTRSGATWLIARAVNDHTPFWAFLLFVPYLYIVTLLPLATSRFGLEQGTFVVLFGAVGMPAETALTVSLLSVFATMVIALPGAFWLATDRLHPKRPRPRTGAPTASRVIVHADDYGETIEITKGITAGIEAGSVTSTSILANMPGTTYALSEARRLGRRASFGAHLNLCEGLPVAPGASLVRADGRFVSKRTLAVRAFAGWLDLGEVRRELEAQIARIRDAGVEVSHLDSHKHLHQLPGVARVVAELAADLGLQRVRCTLEEDFWPAGTRLVAGLSRLVRRDLAHRLARELDTRGLRYPARTLDLAYLMRLPPGEAQRDLLIRPDTVTEMFCHPGTPEADREKPGSCDRAAELDFLRSEAFTGLRRDANLELVTYWEL